MYLPSTPSCVLAFTVSCGNELHKPNAGPALWGAHNPWPGKIRKTHGYANSHVSGQGWKGRERQGTPDPAAEFIRCAYKPHADMGGATPLQTQGTRITSSTLPDFTSAPNIVFQRSLMLAVPRLCFICHSIELNIPVAQLSSWPSADMLPRVYWM